MKPGQRSSPVRQRSRGNGPPKVRVQPDHQAKLEAGMAAMERRMAGMEMTLNGVKNAWDRMGTSREAVRDRIERDRADLDVQFQRIAAMQAEIDLLKARETTLQAEVDRLRARDRSLGTV